METATDWCIAVIGEECEFYWNWRGILEFFSKKGERDFLVNLVQLWLLRNPASAHTVYYTSKEDEGWIVAVCVVVLLDGQLGGLFSVWHKWEHSSSQPTAASTYFIWSHKNEKGEKSIPYYKVIQKLAGLENGKTQYWLVYKQIFHLEK